MAGGGIGEAALLGAALGGGTALVTGQDPLKGALMGSLTGGAFSGIGSALGAAAGAGADLAATTANAGAPTLSNAVTSGAAATTDAAARQALTGALGNPAAELSSLGAFGQAPQLNSLSNLANSGTQVAQNAGIASGIPNATPFVSQGLDTSAEAMQLLQQSGQQAAAPAAQGGIRSMFNLKPDSLASKGLDWWDKQDTLTQAGIGGLGLMGADAAMNPYEAPTLAKYKSKLAGYNREGFSPYEPQPVTPYYQAQYAEGGIAALANGPQNAQGGMFPQSQQTNTQYATPSQMPTSAEVVNSGYEPQTNPYTGEPVGYASGGATVAFPSASNTAAPQQYNAAMPLFMQNQNESQGMSGLSGMSSGRAQQIGMGSIGRMIADVAGKANNNAARFDPTVFRKGQAAQEAQRPRTSSHIYRPQYAEGGIAGYSLGGYAAGGNPRLLKGPGDGVSDDIPAVIGGKQPARLADGEFVLPARIVSELGNGSTDAGAKALYAMMDRVQNGRKKSIGKNKVATNTNPTKHLPV